MRRLFPKKGAGRRRSRANTILMSLVLLRHCQSEDNARGVFVGRQDSPLSALGRKTAAALRVEAAVWFASPLSRAHETARAVAAREEDIILDDALLERDWGAMSGLTFAEASESLGAAHVKRVCSSRHTRAPGGESEADVQERVSRLLIRRVVPLVARGGIVGIVSHSRALEAICSVLGQRHSRLECGQLIRFCSPQLFPDDHIISLPLARDGRDEDDALQIRHCLGHRGDRTSKPPPGARKREAQKKGKPPRAPPAAEEKHTKWEALGE